MRNTLVANALALAGTIVFVASFVAAWATPTDANGRGDFSTPTGLLCVAFVLAVSTLAALPPRRF